uniref:DOMON domain-containing protein n=1 Tax=Angiostrongylus cantonensis TaxID=6313 RepID=A0A0K0CWR1_ANGCA
MVTRSKLNGFWTGFFLGDEQPMDALGAFVRDERVDLMDGHVTNNGVVQMDNITNIQYMMFDKQEHSLVTKFSRPLTRTDSSDADLSRCISNIPGFVKRAAAAVCEYRKGGNTVTWNAAGDNVEFLIEQDAKRGKWWSGIGIGKSMKDMKAAVAFLENGVVKTVAGCQTQGYGMPKPDPMVNPVLNKRNSKVRNGRSFVNFAIPKRILDLYSVCLI